MNRSYSKHFYFVPSVVDIQKDSSLSKLQKRCKSALDSKNDDDQIFMINSNLGKLVETMERRLGKNRVKLSAMIEYGQEKQLRIKNTKKKKVSKFELRRQSFNKYLSSVSLKEDKENHN